MKDIIFTLLVVIGTCHIGFGQSQDHNIDEMIIEIEAKLQPQKDSLFFFRDIIEGLSIAEKADQSIGITIESRNRIREPFKRIINEHYCLCINTMPIKDATDGSVEGATSSKRSSAIEAIDNCKIVCEQVWSFLQKVNKN